MTAGSKGFTLVEVLVASTIGAFIALVAVGALKAVSTSAELVDRSMNASAEVRFASQMLLRDLENLYRAKDVNNMKLVGSTISSGEGGQSSDVTFYTVGRSQARRGQPEGDVYEVEYSLVRKDDKSVLTRRLWPNPDKEAKPGGVMTVIAEDIDVFQVRYFDGEDWQVEWPEDIGDVPKLVEVDIAYAPRNGRKGPRESFMVNFARSGWGSGPGAGAEGSSGNGEETSSGR